MRLHDINPDPRSAAERLQADLAVRAMSDAEAWAQVGGPSVFDADKYLRQNPDLAALPTWNRDPVRHYLAYGKFEGRPFPTKDAASVSIAPAYEVQPLPPIPQTLFPMTPASPVLTAAAPRVAPTGIDREIERQANEAAAHPSWLIPAALAAAAAFFVVPKLLKQKRR